MLFAQYLGDITNILLRQLIVTELHFQLTLSLVSRSLIAPLQPSVLDVRGFNLNNASQAFEHEWKYPSNQAFMVLLLLGGDVVSKALGQLAGGPITPVAFSFGFAMIAINSAVGQNKLMPAPDTACQVINAKSKQSRGNTSWILGRVMRDFEYWQRMDKMRGEEVPNKTVQVRKMKQEHDDNIRLKQQSASMPRKDGEHAKPSINRTENAKKPKNSPEPDRAGLVVSFWSFDPKKRHLLKQPGRDFLFWSGIFVSILQLGIAAIPFGVYGNWGVFLITAAAILLCFVTGSAPQWRQEKWKCREIEEDERKAYFLTRGNGAQHAIYIECDGCGLNLEDLCTGFENIDTSSVSLSTRLFFISLGFLWVCLLLTSSALGDQAWFLIAVGGVGMLQNIMVAGVRRNPEALGMPLEYQGVIGFPRVIDTIYEVEKRHRNAGWALAGTFFPAGLRQEEKDKMNRIHDVAQDTKPQETSASQNLGPQDAGGQVPTKTTQQGSH